MSSSQPHYTHNPGPLKQHNKPYKAKFTTKGSVKAASKGKTERSSVTSIAPTNTMERRERDRQRAISAREASLATARASSALALSNIPKLIAVVPLDDCLDVPALMQSLLSQASSVVTKEKTVEVVTKHKKRLTLLLSNPGSLVDMLDACKVAEHVLLIISGTTGDLSSKARATLSMLLQQGVPSPLMAAVDAPLKIRAKLRDAAQSLLPAVTKLHPLDTAADAEQVLRFLGAQMTPGKLAWRDQVPYMLGEKVEVRGTEVGITGWLRSWNLSANRLAAICGISQAFQINRICSADQADVVLEESDAEKRESLQYECPIDETLAEQTWPTEEEMAEASKPQTKKKRVPEGTSEYQAAWLFDSDMEDDDGGEPAEHAPAAAEAEEKMEEVEEKEEKPIKVKFQDEPEDEDEDGLSEGDDEDDEKKAMDEEAASKEPETEEERRRRECDEETEYPDEVDTPHSIPARVRFQKYRGLKSFRSSPWDPLQNLPLDYGRIFQLKNYRKMAKRACEDRSGVAAGTQVTVWLQCTEEQLKQINDIWQPSCKSPLVLSGLRKHENRATVLHFNVRRLPAEKGSVMEQATIRSKDPMWLQVGFRRFRACPVFSEFTHGMSKHKFTRYLRPGESACLTAFGPVCYLPAPLMVFRDVTAPIPPKNPNEPKADPETTSTAAPALAPEKCPDCLVATGSLLTADPERIVCKKIILTASPFKIIKKRAVVRGMFWNPDDVQWFKPVELYTKLGREGRIIEPVGTHGRMKCQFDAALRANDTIAMNLYKRVFPRWVPL